MQQQQVPPGLIRSKLGRMMSDPNDDMKAKVEAVRRLRIAYEAVDEEIDALLDAHGGEKTKLPEPEHDTYRQLARQRDELLNEIQILEQQLFAEDDDN